MTDQEALVLNVCRYPDDDLARLVAADYFEENGDPLRADFIRVMHEQDVRDLTRPLKSPKLAPLIKRMKDEYPAGDTDREALWMRMRAKFGWRFPTNQIRRGWPTHLNVSCWDAWRKLTEKGMLLAAPLTSLSFGHRHIEPLTQETGSVSPANRRWLWVRSGGYKRPPNSHLVPDAVMDEMLRLRNEPPTFVNGSEVYTTTFCTRAAALKCLEVATLNVGRAAHNLPPFGYTEDPS